MPRPLTVVAVSAIAVLGAALLAAGPALAVEGPAPALVVNEVESDGDAHDWVEVYNTSDQTVDAGGLRITDDNLTRTYTVPSGTTIGAHGFAAFDVDDENVAGSFGLGNGDQVHLFWGDTEVDSFSYAAHAATTWGACPDGGDTFVETAAATKGAPNACAADAATALVVNEVESSGGMPGDWVELYNTATAAVDAGGLVIKDDDDAHAFSIPAGTSIPGGGFAAFDVESSYGLGGDDRVRLFAVDGATLIDEYAWTAHAATTYGRCPDGTGEFTTTEASTKAAKNSCPLPVGATDIRINEVESNDDWIELSNRGTSAVDVSGWIIGDDNVSNAEALPADTVVPAAGYLVLEGDVHFTFGLGNGDEVHLYLADGVTVVDEMSYAAHATTSWGRCPDGTGAFVQTAATTPGAANSCAVDPAASIVINEIESNGDTNDWIELYNTGAAAVDLTGWILRDNNDANAHVLPAGTSIEPGGYYVAVTDGTGGFGLGNPDEARLFLPDGTTLVDSFAWQDHAATTYGRCPDGTGEFQTTFASTRGAANDCSLVRINEIESSGGAPVDWIELTNVADEAVDVSGYVLRDDDDTHAVAIPSGTTLQPGAFLAVDVDVDGGFGLGGADTARLFAADGTTLLDSFAWTEHAPTTWARCPDGTGVFEASASSTKGTANDCVGAVAVEAWPGSAEVTVVDEADTFGQDMSGLAYEGTGTGARGTLWAVNNGTGTLFALEWDGSVWAPAEGEWAAGKELAYPDGTGSVDAEGVALLAGDPAAGVYVASERDNAASSVSRPSVLRYDVDAAGTTLVATDEWNLSSVLPSGIGANQGLEGIAWIDDETLVAGGFVDESTGSAYDPAGYAGHGDGLFFVGVEATGDVYAVALADDGAVHLIATIDPGLQIVADLEYDEATGLLWAVCDEVCDGQSATLEIASEGVAAGSFQVTHVYENPEGMDDSIANEGFAIGSADLCVDGLQPVFYADDNQTAGHALRESALDCVASEPEPSPSPEPSETTDPGPGASPSPSATLPGTGGSTTPDESDLTPATRNGISGPATATPGQSIAVHVGADYAGQTVYGWLFSSPTSLGSAVVTAAGTASFTIPSSAELGTHRLTVLDANGDVVGWYEIEIVSTGLAATGARLLPIAPFAAVLLVAGVGLVVVRRRRNAAA